MKDHCVIGRDAFERTWGDEEYAIAHAKKLLIKADKNQNGTKRLFVVKVVKVVELHEPVPPITIRDMVEEDIGNASR